MAADTLSVESAGGAVVAAAEQLSCPLGGGFEAISQTIAVAWAEQQVRRFVHEGEAELARDCPALADFLDEAAGRMTLAGASDSTLGQVEATRRRSGATAVDVAAAWALQLAGALALPGNWSARLSEPLPLMFGGRFLGTGDEVRFSSDGRRATVEFGGRESTQVVRLERAGARWKAPGEPEPTGPLAVVAAGNLPASFLDGIEAETAPAVDPSMEESLWKGLESLRAASRAYDSWVRGVVRQILVLRAEGGRIRSGSRSDFPGLVHMSLPEQPRAVAESLVHEASHQYYHLALHLGRPVTGEDQTLYYSPAVSRSRPLDRLLLAFHAFANVAAMYHAMQEARVVPEAECARQIGKLQPMLEQLRQPMVGNPSMTPLGRALVDPIDRHLVGLGVLPEATA